MEKIKKSIRKKLPMAEIYFDEVKEDKINELEISAYAPYITVDPGPFSATLYSSEDSTLVKGMLVDIEHIIIKGQRRAIGIPTSMKSFIDC